MRNPWLPLSLVLALAGCDEPLPAPITEETPPPPEPEPPAEPPAIGAIAAPEAGQAKVAVPTLNQGFQFPVATLGAPPPLNASSLAETPEREESSRSARS